MHWFPHFSSTLPQSPARRRFCYSSNTPGTSSFKLPVLSAAFRMITNNELKLNLFWIRVLSYSGILPIKIDVKTGRFENCSQSRKRLYLFYWTLVQVQIIYFMWETYWNIKANPESSIHHLSIYNLFVVASLVGTFSSYSYFVLWPEVFILILNESIPIHCNFTKSSSSTKVRSERRSGQSTLSVFTKFIPVIHIVSAGCSIVALTFVSWPAMCGSTPLFLCPVSLLQGLSIFIALAWCYSGVLVQILFISKVTDALTQEIGYARSNARQRLRFFRFS